MIFSFFPKFFGKISSFFKNLSDVRKKIMIASVCVVVVFAVIFATLILNKNKSAVHLECFSQNESSPLVALNFAAQKGVLRASESAYFKFTQNQKDFFHKTYDEYSTASLTVRIKIAQKKEQNAPQNDFFQFGFLTNEDFSEKGKFLNRVSQNSRPIIQGNAENAPQILDISFAVPKSTFQSDVKKAIPQGFFITSDYECKIVAACIAPSEIGFDMSYEIPFYSFACNGGIIDFNNVVFDFSGASMVFPVENSSNSTMPEFSIGLTQSPENKSTFQDKVVVSFTLGGEKFYVNNVKTASQIIIPSAAAKSPFSKMELTQNPKEITSFILRATKNRPNENGETLIPVKTDPGLLLNYDKSAWRTLDYEIFEWDRFPGILFFDTRNYNVQDNFFRRLAYFVEKAGFKGRLLTNEELQGKHGYNAHDYSANSLADFFNKASELDFPLNKEEEILKKILEENGLLEFDGEKFIARDGGIVSISQESATWLRSTLLSHEGWHTLFFKDEEFRNFVAAVYYTMDQTSAEFVREYFKSQPGLGYDTNDEYLMLNEFMAYVMQQKISEVANYFVHLANRGSVMKFTPQLAAYVRKTSGKPFEDAAIALNDFVFDKYGIIGGDISLVKK